MISSKITVKATAEFRFATPKCTLHLHSHYTTAGADTQHTLKVICEGADRAEVDEIMLRVRESLVAALTVEDAS
jgi:hypothetical protein